MRFLEGHRVEYVRDGGVGDVRDVVFQSGSGQRPIEDVRRAEGEEQVLVVQGRGRDDGRETGQSRELDTCTTTRVGTKNQPRSMGVHTVLSEGRRASHDDDGLVCIFAETTFCKWRGET